MAEAGYLRVFHGIDRKGAPWVAILACAILWGDLFSVDLNAA